MAEKHLEILRKGLECKEKGVRKRKEILKARLAAQQPISSEDELWLDNEANTTEEQRLIYQLESASDYDLELEGLDEEEKKIVNRLREWAGDIVKATGVKRKRKFFICY